jgi:hypothetical protein
VPLDLPSVPPATRQRLRAQRRRRRQVLGCRPVFKIIWGAAVTLSTMAWWLVDNCDPPGRWGVLFDALETLNDARPAEDAPAPTADPVGQSQENR